MENKSVEKKIAFSFISLKQSCYIEATGGDDLLGKFLLLFKYTVNSEGFDYLLEGIQQNSISLKLNVNKFLDQYGSNFPQLNGVRSFLNLLPDNHYFLIVGKKVTDSFLIMQYFKFLTQYHNKKGIPQTVSEETFEWGKTFENYNIRIFGHQRRNIGNRNDKENRICRFCDSENGQLNKFGSLVSFRNRSHAYSEALGNKNVINKDECDACNDRFSRGIEPSLINYFQFFRSLYGLKGKGGTKKLTGENFVLDPQKGFDVKYDGIIDPKKPIDQLKTDLYFNDTFIPQDIYRCLVKFILSVIDNDDCIKFKKTIDWVNGVFNADKLPMISCVQHQAFYKEQSMLCYYQKKSENNLPYMIGEFHYADIVLVYIIPFCSQDTTDYTLREQYDAYWKEFNQIRTFHDWQNKDFSSIDPLKMIIKLKVEGIDLEKNAFISSGDCNKLS